MSSSGYVNKIAFFFAGATVGAVIGLLLAPKSGQETREYIAGKAAEGRDYLVDRGRELRKQTEEFVDKSKNYVAKQRDRLAEALKEA